MYIQMFLLRGISITRLWFADPAGRIPLVYELLPRADILLFVLPDYALSIFTVFFMKLLCSDVENILFPAVCISGGAGKIRLSRRRNRIASVGCCAVAPVKGSLCFALCRHRKPSVAVCKKAYCARNIGAIDLRHLLFKLFKGLFVGMTVIVVLPAGNDGTFGRNLL